VASNGLFCADVPLKSYSITILAFWPLRIFRRLRQKVRKCLALRACFTLDANYLYSMSYTTGIRSSRGPGARRWKSEPRCRDAELISLAF